MKQEGSGRSPWTQSPHDVSSSSSDSGRKSGKLSPIFHVVLAGDAADGLSGSGGCKQGSRAADRRGAQALSHRSCVSAAPPRTRFHGRGHWEQVGRNTRLVNEFSAGQRKPTWLQYQVFSGSWRGCEYARVLDIALLFFLKKMCKEFFDWSWQYVAIYWHYNTVLSLCPQTNQPTNPRVELLSSSYCHGVWITASVGCYNR